MSAPTASQRRLANQRDRVLACLQAAPAGVNETAFAAPVVIDGGPPVQRVAARVYELRRAGHDIRTHLQPDRTATYVLRTSGSTADPAPDEQLALPVAASRRPSGAR